MKRLLLILCLVPGLCFGALTEFYCRASGSNLNGGALSTGAEPATTAAYTSTNGAWSTVTNNFTPSDGSTPASTVTVGDFASVYIDGATTAVYIARVTVVAAGVNGAITLDTTAKYGTAPVTSANTRSIKVGGAWLGPNGAATFPFGLSGTIGALKNSNSDQARLNVKNNTTYTMTAALVFTTLGNAVLQGYTSTAGDLGKTIFTSNITSAANFTTAAATPSNPAFVDLIFVNTGASNSNHLFTITGTADSVFLRTVFHGARNCGLVSASGNAPNTILIECEAYDNNKANGANQAGFAVANAGGGMMFCYRCYSHDNTGSNTAGFESSSASNIVLVDCIADTNGGSGAKSVASAQGLICINSNFYNNTGDGVNWSNTNANTWAVLINNNFLLNAKGVNNTVTAQGGILYNNGRGAGTQANTGADVLKSIVNTSTDITFASNTTPWDAPTTGNFSTTLGSAAIAAGRGVFTETDGTNTGTLAYPVIGAAEAPTPTATPTSTPTPTATATATATPTNTPTPTATPIPNAFPFGN